MQTPLIAFRLLVAAAWLDGEIHPLEATLLAQYLAGLQLTDEMQAREIDYLRLRPAADTSTLWIEQFRQAHPTPTEQERVIAAVKQMMKADGRVVEEEAQLLAKLETALHGDHPSLLQRLKTWLVDVTGRSL